MSWKLNFSALGSRVGYSIFITVKMLRAVAEVDEVSSLQLAKIMGTSLFLCKGAGLIGRKVTGGSVSSDGLWGTGSL